MLICLMQFCYVVILLSDTNHVSTYCWVLQFRHLQQKSLIVLLPNNLNFSLTLEVYNATAVEISTRNIDLFSKQSSLFTFYAVQSAMVHSQMCISFNDLIAFKWSKNIFSSEAFSANAAVAVSLHRQAHTAHRHQPPRQLPLLVRVHLLPFPVAPFRNDCGLLSVKPRPPDLICHWVK